ncbi:MAG: 16S rRNA (cytidine(1402)-2'-O)-methyltransferase [Rhizobacter sp.]
MTTLIAPLLLQAAAAAAGNQQYPAGALYVVATPIGNLADLTLRAIHVLSLVDAVACEDTRHTAPLLRHLGLDKPLLAVHQHNEQASSSDVIARLARGERVAYVSDAGTPAVSDPGAALVAAVAASGRPVVAVPGASSAVTAVSVAGDTVGSGFRFIGFLPSKGNERVLALKALATAGETQVLFEAPHRIEALAVGLAEACGARAVTLCRELTKQFETVATLSASALPGWLACDPNRLRGEFVLVLHAVAPGESDDDAARHDVVLQTLLAELPLKQAVSLAAALSGAPRNALYARALELKGSAVD